jgi:hypothetical protein
LARQRHPIQMAGLCGPSFLHSPRVAMSRVGHREAVSSEIQVAIELCVDVSIQRV